MDDEIPPMTRQRVEQQVKSALALVYPNVLPNVLTLEVGMIESKAFATAKTRGQYIINVSCYISAHNKRKNGAQCVHHIPALTQQEENARLAQVGQSINAGEDKIAHQSSQINPAKEIVDTVPSNTSLAALAKLSTQPVPVGSTSSARAFPSNIGSSSQPVATAGEQLRQPSAAVAVTSSQPSTAVAVPSAAAAGCSSNPSVRCAVPHLQRISQGISQEKYLQVKKILEEHEEHAVKIYRDKILKQQRTKALRAQQAHVQGASALQTQQALAQQDQKVDALQTQQAQVLQPQAQQSHMQLAQSTNALQRLQVQGLNPQPVQLQTLQTRQAQALQVQQPIAGLQTITLQGQQPFQLQKHPHIPQQGTQLRAVSKNHPKSQSKHQTQRQKKTCAVASGPSHSQVIAPLNARNTSQMQSSTFTHDRGQLQTIQQAQNVTQINHSPQNLIRAPVQTLPQNQALSGIKAHKPPNNVPQVQGLVQNQVFPIGNSVSQVQTLPQQQIPPEMLTDEALQALSPDQLRSLLKQAYAPNRRGLEALSQVQNGNGQSVLNYTTNNPLLQRSAATKQAVGGTSHLTLQQALQQAPVLQSKGLHPPMVSPNEKKSQGGPFMGAKSQGLQLQNEGNQGQGLPTQISQNRVRSLPLAQNNVLHAQRMTNSTLNSQLPSSQGTPRVIVQQLPISSQTQGVNHTALGQTPNQVSRSLPGNHSMIGRVSSLQNILSSRTKDSTSLAPQQQMQPNSAAQNFEYRKQHNERTISDLAGVSTRFEDAARKSMKYSAIAQTQKGAASQNPLQPVNSSHVNTGLPRKSHAVIQSNLAQDTEPSLAISREKQVLLANWITFQRDYRARLDRIFPILKTLFTSNPTENEKRTLRNIQTIRTALHQSTTRLAESDTANSNYHGFLDFVHNVFQKYGIYEQITASKVVKDGSNQENSGGANSSLHCPAQLSQSTDKSPLAGTARAEVLLSQMQQNPATNLASQSQGYARTQICNPEAKPPFEQKRITKARTRAPAALNRMATSLGTDTRIGQALRQVHNHNSPARAPNRIAVRAENAKESPKQTQAVTAQLNETAGNCSKETTAKQVETHFQALDAESDTLTAAAALRKGASSSNDVRPTVGQSVLDQGAFTGVTRGAKPQSLNSARSPFNRAHSVPSFDKTGKGYSRDENLEITAEQSNDMGVLFQRKQSSANAQMQDPLQRNFSASEPVNLPDVERVQAIVQQHVKTNVEKKLREYIANFSAPSSGNPSQARIIHQNVNNPAEQTNLQPNTTDSATDDQNPAQTLPFGSTQVIHGTKASAANSHTNPSAGNVLTDKTTAAVTGQVNVINSAVDNQTAAPKHPAEGFGAQLVDVSLNDATIQQGANDAADKIFQDTLPKSSGEVEKNLEISQDDFVLQIKLEELVEMMDHFETAIGEDPVLNGTICREETEARADEEAISELQDVLDCKKLRKRSARVEETLMDLSGGRTESKEAKMNDLKPAAKKQKKLSLREQVEFDCELVRQRYASVKCLIEEELDKPVVMCNFHMKEHRIPSLKMTVLEGYPLVGKIHYNVETSSSGWLPQFDNMISRFSESMRSVNGDFSVSVVVGKWVTAVQSVLTSE